METNPEEVYIQKCREGDTQAYTFLVDRYKGLVFTLSLKIVGNREEAEEVSQDAFVTAFKRLGSFKGDSKFSTWLYAITYRKCLDVLKKRKRHEVLTEDLSKISLLAEITRTEWEQEEEERTFKTVIDSLPKKDAALVFLFYYDNLSIQEISQVTDCKPTTVKVRLHRIRKVLAPLLKKYLVCVL